VLSEMKALFFMLLYFRLNFDVKKSKSIFANL
jgi:hypothetical protein